MPFFQELDALLHLTRSFSERMMASIATTSCAAAREEECRDDEAALRLKAAAFAAILVAGAVGVALPLLGARKGRLPRADGGVFVFVKAFAAGVVLATGFVHMLHASESALTDPCLPDSPWRVFPFADFVAMAAALGTLVVDFVGTQYYVRKHRAEAEGSMAVGPALPAMDEEEITVVKVMDAESSTNGKGSMRLVGMHAYAAAHRYCHPHVHGACQLPSPAAVPDKEAEGGEASTHVRHVVASQVLELGIVSHSVIIGISLGVSRSPCTIRPLVAALSFHQFFEGFALGGCITQARFTTAAAAAMGCFFAITTPAGIAIGAVAAASYNESSPRALVAEGLLDATSAGILIYTALVDLIAADFLSRTISWNVRSQVASYFALVLGAGAMSALAIWA